LRGEEKWKKVPSNLKSSLTRKFNSSSHSSQALVREELENMKVKVCVFIVIVFFVILFLSFYHLNLFPSLFLFDFMVRNKRKNQNHPRKDHH